MDVTCEHCSTEYEFDDALISARGTTVQCTQCGYRFRVRAGDPSEDVWRVRTRQGAVVEFTSLQKLQEALVRREIGADDELTRGRSNKSRRLGAIPELEGFLAGDAVLSATKRTTSSGVRTDASSAPVTATDADYAAGPPSVPRRTITLRPEASMPPPSASGAEVDAQISLLDVPDATRLPPVAERGDSKSIPRALPVPTFSQRTRSASGVELGPEEGVLLSSPLPPVARQASIVDEFEVAGNDGRGSTHPQKTKRAHVSGWVVAVVATALVAASSAAWFRFHDSSHLQAPTAVATASIDSVQNAALEPVQALIALDDAHGALLALQRLSRDDQQSAQGRVLAARAQLRKVDVRWFATELASDLSARAAARAELDKALAAAGASVDALPSDGAYLGAATVLRADLLRLRGDRDGARKLLRQLGAAEPDDLEYVRGALESSDPQPDVATTLKLLRLAAAKEPKPGRAAAMMAYVLARSGDAASARAELQRFAGRSEESERVAALRAFMTRFDGVDAGADDAGVATSVVPEDPRRMLAEASSALQRGDSARARVLYQAALDKNPADSEALAGLGDVARGVGDLTRAKEYYQKAVAANGSFLPALIALADIQWDGGDRSAAARTYQDIFDRVPEGAYPPRVRERRQGAAGGTPTAIPVHEPTAKPGPADPSGTPTPTSSAVSSLPTPPAANPTSAPEAP